MQMHRMTRPNPFVLVFTSTTSATLLASTVYTLFTPTRAANGDKILITHLTARTVAPRNTSGRMEM